MSQSILNAGIVLATIELTTAAATSSAHRLARWPDKTVQVTGTFGSGTVAIQGSNDGTNWFPITKAGGSAASFTAAGGALLVENPLYLRATISGSTGATVEVTIVGAE